MVKKPTTQKNLVQCKKCKRWFTKRALVWIRQNHWCRDCHSKDTIERIKEGCDI